MKKIMICIAAALITGSSLYAQNRPTLTKDEAHQIVLATFPNVITDANESEFLATGSGTASNERRHVYSEIGWYDPSTGCWGATITWVHCFLGIHWGSAHETTVTYGCA